MSRSVAAKKASRAMTMGGLSEDDRKSVKRKLQKFQKIAERNISNNPTVIAKKEPLKKRSRKSTASDKKEKNTTTKKAKRRDRSHILYDSDCESDDDEPGCLRIKPIKVKRKDVLKNNQYNNIPSHPYRCIFTGATGSGKTTNMINLLTRKRFLQNYFHKIYLYSPNVNIEEEFKKIEKKNKKTEVIKRESFDEQQLAEDFAKIVQSSKRMGDNRKALPRILFFIDDFASDKLVMSSEILIDMFFRCRKQSCSVWISTQHYKAPDSRLRNNAENHVIYMQNDKETEKIAEELAVGPFTCQIIKQWMYKVSSEAYAFLFVNRKLTPMDGRFAYTYDHKIIPPQPRGKVKGGNDRLDQGQKKGMTQEIEYDDKDRVRGDGTIHPAL